MARKVTSRRADEARFNILYTAHADAILSYLLRRSSSVDDAVELFADVCTVAWRRLHEVPDGDNARLSLFGVARLTLQNERRRQRRRPALIDRLKLELSATTRTADPVDSSVRSIAEGLASLDADDRELLMLTGWDGLTPAQIEEVIDVPAATVRVRLHRARKRLRAALDLDPSEHVQQRIVPVGQVHGRGATRALPGHERN